MEILAEGCAQGRVRPELGEFRRGLEHEGDDREVVVEPDEICRAVSVRGRFRME